MMAWWQGRSQREQILLGVMFGLFAVMFLWLGIMRPLASARDTAEERHRLAVTDFAARRGQIDAIKALKAKPPQPLGTALPEFLRISAGQAGFTNAMVDPGNNGRARLSIPAAKGAALFAWIDRLDGRGVFIERATIRPNSDATIAVEATFAARGE